MREISRVLEKELFLQNDYVIYKNDIGEEMYFIINGTVVILSKYAKFLFLKIKFLKAILIFFVYLNNYISKRNEDKALLSLDEGYFGELALFSPNSKRMCSIICSEIS